MPAHPRPHVVTLTAVVDAVVGIFFVASSAVVLARGGEPSAVLVVIGLLHGVLAVGLWRVDVWARWLQIVLSVPFLCLGYTTFSSVILLGYYGQARTAGCFAGGTPTCWHTATRWTEGERPWLVAYVVVGLGGMILWGTTYIRLAQSGFMR